MASFASYQASSCVNKYTQEDKYNEIIGQKGNIRVFCRCRPLSFEEMSKGVASVVEFDPHHDSGLHVICSDNARKQFKFDHVFNPKDDQEIVFAETLPVVKSVMDGYNVCIFAYGKTGTGKTFTMEGTSENRGVNYRALEELFKSSTERSSIDRYEFLVSMLEVYNEKIRDLLAENSNQPAKKLEIKQIDGTQDVPGLVEAQACGMDAVWEIFKTGKKNRSIGSTLANEQSSRSHCLVRVTVKGKNLINGQRSRSRMWLVDLAGSERVIRTEGDKERLKESQFINKSLSALGDVISALASKNPHIPYRNSKLTHLLQSSLGGDCKTLMFTQISPSSTDLAKTLCSLNFASRVRGIECGPARKQYDPAGSFKFKQMVEKLQREEKENAISNESLLLKALQEKVREQDNLIAEMNKAKIQIGNRDACKYCKRPRTPINVRKPLSQITNRLPPGGSQKISSRTMRTFENVHRSKQLTSFRQAGRPVGLSIPVQPKRSPTVAILPTEAERPQLPPNGQGIGGFNISLSSICNWKPLRLPGTAMRIVCKTPATRTMCKTPATRTMCKTRRQTVI